MDFGLNWSFPAKGESLPQHGTVSPIPEGVNVINSFVAMFDFLGYKQLRASKGTDGLFQLYVRGLLPQIQHAAAGAGKVVTQGKESFFVPNPGVLSVRFQAISDTVIMSADGSDFDAFMRVINAARQLVQFGFVGHHAPLRGAIGYGDLALNENQIWLGQFGGKCVPRRAESGLGGVLLDRGL